MTEFTRRHFAAFAASGLAHRAVVSEVPIEWIPAGDPFWRP